MKTKVCTNIICEQPEKPLSEFELRSDTGKYRNECKDCRKKYKKEYYKKYPWKRTLVIIKQRCENPNAISYPYYGE